MDGVLTLTLTKSLAKRRGGLKPIDVERGYCRAHSATSSIPSEAAGLLAAAVGPDTHPSVRDQEVSSMTSNGFEKVGSRARHCFTQTTALLTDEGACGAGDFAVSGGTVKSVVLEAGSDAAESGSSQTPKNGLSPA